MKICGMSTGGGVRRAVGLGLALAAGFCRPLWAAEGPRPPTPADAMPLTAPITALVVPPEPAPPDAAGGSTASPPEKAGPGNRATPGADDPARRPDDAVIDLSPQHNGAAPRDEGLGRDPTQPGPNMRRLLAPRSKGLAVPNIQLKARIVTAGQPPVVILGIDKNMYLAKLGDEFTPAGDANGLSIRVTTINEREVRLDLSPLGRSVILY